MKRFGSLILAALLLCCLLLPASAAEDDLFDRSIRRFNDYSETVTEEQELQLNAKVREKIDALRMDLPVCVFYTRNSDTTLSEFAEDYYARNKYGCGEDKSGLLLVVDTKNASYDIYYYGEADTLIADDARERLSDAFKAACHNEDLTWYDAFDRYYDTAFRTVENARKRAEDALPDWYPEQTEGFTDYHGEDLPPVVDDALIFTPEQIQTLSDKIRAMNERLGIGYVVFTTDYLYGLTPEEYSSDFLHFNGYGVGDDFGAVGFFLCLDLEDRCWLTMSINSYESVFTSDVTYEIDEIVDSSIRSGDYYEAFLLHVDYVDKLFSAWSEDLPAWYPEGTRTYELKREGRDYGVSAGSTAPRGTVEDKAGSLSDAQKQTFSDALQLLSEQYGVDLVIYTDTDVRAPRSTQYADDFYYYNGFGENGVCLFLFGEDGSRYGTLCYGNCKKYASLNIENELRDTVRSGDTAQVIEKYIELLTFMLKHGRLPMQKATAGFCLAVGVVAGLIAAAIVTDKLKDAMKIKSTVAAQTYLVNGSFVLLGSSSHYLYSTVTKRAKPKETNSSSGSSSGGSRGGSSYSSGRSAGGSYSGGGRRF